MAIFGALAALLYAVGVGAFVGAFVRRPLDGIVYGGVILAIAAVLLGVVYGLTTFAQTFIESS